MQIVYLANYTIPADSTPTIQLVSTVAALGQAGADVTLVFLAPASGAPAAGQIAAYYHVAPSFKVAPIAAPTGILARMVRRFPFLKWIRLAAHARRTKADAIYSRSLDLAIAALLFARIPVFYETFHPYPAKSPAFRILFRLLKNHRRLAGLILHSAFAAKSYAAIGYGGKRLLVAHNGVDLRQFAELPAPETARRKLGAGDERRIFAVYAGNIGPGKGVGYLLDAAERLPDIFFALVGAKHGGLLENRAGRMENVRIFPWQNRTGLMDWLAAADILVVPPTSALLRGFTVLPIKIFEYLAAGRPIIAGATPDISEVLTDGVNARLVPPDDPAAFDAALRELAADKSLRERLSRGACESAIQYDAGARAIRIRDFIERRLGPA